MHQRLAFELYPAKFARCAALLLPGNLLPPEALPLVIALSQKRPAHSDFWIRGSDNVRRHIEVTAFPLTGQAGRDPECVAIFWEVP